MESRDWGARNGNDIIVERWPSTAIVGFDGTDRFPFVVFLYVVLGVCNRLRSAMPRLVISRSRRSGLECFDHECSYLH